MTELKEGLYPPSDGSASDEPLIAFSKGFFELCKKYNIARTIYIHHTDEGKLVWGGHTLLLSYVREALKKGGFFKS